MSIRRSAKRGDRANELRLRQVLRKRLGQVLRVEPLEDRRVMAGPQLVGILPDDGHLLQPNETLDVAPLDLTFRFDENQVLDFNTVTGIQICARDSTECSRRRRPVRISTPTAPCN